MSRPPIKTIALVVVPVLLLAAVLGGIAAGALDDETETLTTVVTADQASAEGQGVPASGAGEGVSSDGLDAADAGVVDTDDRPLGRVELDRVRAAALSISGGGTVIDVDRSDDLGEAYEVEVLTDAGEVDIALDQRLERVPNLRYDD